MFFNRVHGWLRKNRPHVTDWKMVARLGRAGFDAFDPLDLNNIEPAIEEAFNATTEGATIDKGTRTESGDTEGRMGVDGRSR